MSRWKGPVSHSGCAILWLPVAAWFASGCAERSTAYEGRVYLAPLRAESGINVGLSIDYIAAPDSNRDVHLVEVEVQASGVAFAEGGPSRLCLRLPDSGRRGLLADASGLGATARVRVIAHAPPTPGAGGAGTGGTSGQDSSLAPTCSGAEIDDAVWPTVGAQAEPEPPTGGAGGAGGETGSSGGQAGNGGE